MKKSVQKKSVPISTHKAGRINGDIKIKVEERTPTYMLKKENEYIYINNQGYILEVSEQPIAVPSITGYTTEELVPGGRLNVKDLKNLENIIQIMMIVMIVMIIVNIFLGILRRVKWFWRNMIWRTFG